MGDFAATVREFSVKAKENMDRQVREITFALFSDVIRMSPVGNPELWASNRVAHEYNVQVKAHNADLRDDPANLDKRGYLKRGLKINDGMDIVKPKGYVGGHFRGSWQTSVSAPITTNVDRIDPTGSAATADVLMNMGGAGKVTFMANNLPYGPRLEFEGWSKQAPAGMVRIAMARIDSYIAELK